MKKKIIIGSLVAFFLMSAFGFYMYNKPHENIQRATADIKLTAVELFSIYETDETIANEKFLDKLIEVDGTVQEVKVNEEGKTILNMEGGDLMFGIICELDPFTTHKRTEFTIGERVILKGICTGKLMDIVLVRCVEV